VALSEVNFSLLAAFYQEFKNKLKFLKKSSYFDSFYKKTSYFSLFTI